MQQMKVAAQPGLYDPEDSTPMLKGTRCEACGSTFFPPLGIGCEVCGAGEEALCTVGLAGSGVLRSVATVYVHAGKDIDPPFTVAEVQLDEGPLIRAVLAEPVEADAIGSRVNARWVVTTSDAQGNDVVEPRFALVAGDVK